MTVSLDWENLGFSYMKLPYRYLAHYRNGAWEKGELTEDATLHLSESSPSLHYGQQANCSVQIKTPNVCNAQQIVC